MTKRKKRGPSAYNTPYDELPEYFAIFSPYTWLWLVEIMLMMLGGSLLVGMIADNFFPFAPIELEFLGLVLFSLAISTPNFMLAYGYSRGIIFLQLLAAIYVVASIPNFFFDYAWLALFPFICGSLVFWITTTEKFRVFVLHRMKMGEWKREQLEKNKVRREVIKERKAEEKARRKVDRTSTTKK